MTDPAPLRPMIPFDLFPEVLDRAAPSPRWGNALVGETRAIRERADALGFDYTETLSTPPVPRFETAEERDCWFAAASGPWADMHRRWMLRVEQKDAHASAVYRWDAATRQWRKLGESRSESGQ